jgi:ubiquinone/menaquinone biosynthesis C-methylase UbiE
LKHFKDRFRRLSDEERYDAYARSELKNILENKIEIGVHNFPVHHTPPFLEYYSRITELITKEMNVLELGIGSGRHSYPLAHTGASIVGLDISQDSLMLCKSRNLGINLLKGSIEQIPLDDSSIDAIVSCASLSYGEPKLVNSEILRVLKPGGIVIFLDTLKGNELYAFNRYLKFLRGQRTYNSVKNIVDRKRLLFLHNSFAETSTYYYGAYLWIFPLISIVVGNRLANRINFFLESKIPSGKRALKFVFVGINLKK